MQNLSVLAAAASGQPPVWLQFAPLIGMGLVMWFLFLRPQMNAQKAHKAKLAGIKKGDSVLTGGGFVAKVVKVEDDFLDLELGPNVKVRALKSTITDVLSPAAGKPAND